MTTTPTPTHTEVTTAMVNLTSAYGLPVVHRPGCRTPPHLPTVEYGFDVFHALYLAEAEYARLGIKRPYDLCHWCRRPEEHRATA